MKLRVDFPCACGLLLGFDIDRLEKLRETEPDPDKQYYVFRHITPDCKNVYRVRFVQYYGETVRIERIAP